MTTGGGSDLTLLKRVLGQARHYWRHIAGIYLLGLASTALTLLLPLPLKIAVDSGIGSQPLPSLFRALLPEPLTSSGAPVIAVAASLLVAALTFFWPAAWIGALLMLAAALVVAVLQAAQAPLSSQHQGLVSRIVIGTLCYAQPLVRSWKRYRTRLFSYRPPASGSDLRPTNGAGLSLTGARTVSYWTEDGCDRSGLLVRAIKFLDAHGWGKTLDSGWSHWDLEIHCHPWTVVQVCTAQEEHGGGKRLIRVRYRLRLSGYTRTLALGAVVSAGAALVFLSWVPATVAALLAAACLGVWWRGTRRARHVVALFDSIARELGLIRCEPAGRACDHPVAGDTLIKSLSG